MSKVRGALAFLLVFGLGVGAAVLGARGAGARVAVVPHLSMTTAQFSAGGSCGQQATFSASGTATSSELGSGSFSSSGTATFSGGSVTYSETFSATFGNTVVNGTTSGTGQGSCPGNSFTISGTFRTSISSPESGAGSSSVSIAFPTSYSHTFTPDAPPPPPTTTAQPTTTAAPPPTTTAVTTTVVPPVAKITASVQAKWSVTKTFTKVVKLAVVSVPAGATVKVTCTGKKLGCPFTSKTYAVAAGGTVTLTKLFKGKKLKAKARIEIRITQPGAIGKVVEFTIRKTKVPATTVRCLAPGASAPSAC